MVGIRYLVEWAALVGAVCRIRYVSAGMSTRSLTILKKRVSCAFVRLTSRVSQPRWSNMDVTLLVLWYLFVAYLAARRCTDSTLLMSFLVDGLHTVEQYST